MKRLNGEFRHCRIVTGRSCSVKRARESGHVLSHQSSSRCRRGQGVVEAFGSWGVRPFSYFEFWIFRSRVWTKLKISMWSLEVLTTILICFRSKPWNLKHEHPKHKNGHTPGSLAQKRGAAKEGARKKATSESPKSDLVEVTNK